MRTQRFPASLRHPFVNVLHHRVVRRSPEPRAGLASSAPWPPLPSPRQGLLAAAVVLTVGLLGAWVRPAGPPAENPETVADAFVEQLLARPLVEVTETQAEALVCADDMPGVRGELAAARTGQLARRAVDPTGFDYDVDDVTVTGERGSFTVLRTPRDGDGAGTQRFDLVLETGVGWQVCGLV